MNAKTSVLLDGLCFGEGPRWHEGKLWFSDMHAYRVMTVGLDGKSETLFEVPGQPSGLGWLPDGRLLVVSMTDRKLLRLDPAGLVEMADLGEIATHHCNDMVVDGLGRAYVGNFGWDIFAPGDPVPAKLALVLPDGTVRVVAEDLIFPNGSVITPDGRTLIVGESFAGQLTAFDVGPDGSLSNRREWAKLEGVVPDGICLDAEGAIWVASPVSGAVLRVVQGGKVTHKIPVATEAYACMLGGPGRRTLFVCTASETIPEKCREKQDGRIETIEVEVPGAGWP